MSIKFNISQSMLKDFVKYKSENQCGLQFVAKYFDNAIFPSTDAMKLGQYFEYRATGALTKHGEVPEADKTQKGKLSADYERAELHLENYKNLISHYGVTMLSAGIRLIHKNNEGTLDFWGHSKQIGSEQTGKVVIDIKYSGLLYDRYSEFGWDAETLNEKEGTMLQATHYTWLAKKHFNLIEYPTFFFAVFHSKNEHDFKFFKITVSEDKLEDHEETLRKAAVAIAKEFKRGFKPLPDVKECWDCPIKESCKYKITVPPITEIYY